MFHFYSIFWHLALDRLLRRPLDLEAVATSVKHVVQSHEVVNLVLASTRHDRGREYRSRLDTQDTHDTQDTQDTHTNTGGKASMMLIG